MDKGRTEERSKNDLLNLINGNRGNNCKSLEVLYVNNGEDVCEIIKACVKGRWER